MTDNTPTNSEDLSDRALYRRSEEMLFEAARLHCSGRRSGLRKRVRRYLKPYRRDRAFLTSLASSVGRALVVAFLLAQLWAAEANAQPSFSSSSPANATHTTALSNNISATFTEAIAGGTVSSATFVVHGGFIGQHSTGGTASTHQDATYTGQGTTTLTFDAGENFTPGELVSVSLTTGLQNGSAQALTAGKVFQFRTAAGAGPGVFDNTSNNVGTPTNDTREVMLGDFDGDGDLDLVAGNYNVVNRIYLSNGNGTFGAGSNIDTPTNFTRDISIGDLDGDGDLDVVVANNNQVNRLYLGNGNGTFAVGTNVATPTNATLELILGDLDADGDLDLVTGNNSQVNRVYLSNGNGTFAAGNDVATPANATRAVELGDVDGDGDLDLLVANYAQANRIYTGNGNGTFAAGSNVATPANQTQAVRLGDLDGDGDLDLVTGNRYQVNRVYLGNGNATFATGSNIATPTNQTMAVSLGDVDGDGDLDLIMGNNTQVNRMYLGTGTGTFTSGSDVDTPTNNTRAVPLGDLDGDGDLDLATGNSSQVNRAYLNSGALFVSSAPAALSNSVARTANVSATFNQDMNAATSATFVVHGGLTGKRSGGYSGAATSTLTFDPASDFEPGEAVEVSLTTSLQATDAGALQSARVLRFVAAANTAPAVFTNASNGVDAPTNNNYSASLGDLDGDGDLDLVTGNGNLVNRVYLGTGTGTFATGNDVDTPANDTRSAPLGDLDGDGDLDLVTANAGVQANRVYLSNGNGTFASGTNVDTPTNSTDAMSLGDVDGDGDLDLVTGNWNQVNRLYLGNGNGTFASGSDVDTPTNQSTSVSLGDVDGDGDLDLVTGNFNQANRVYLGNGTGTFATGSNVDTPTNQTRSASLGDLDGDGDLDLVTGNDTQVNRVYLGNGNGTFASGSDIDTPTNRTNSVPLGDLDGDGDLDLVTGNDTQVNRVYLGNGNGTFASGTDVDTPTNRTLSVSLGDVDGDGDLDIMAGNYSEVNRVYLNSNTSVSSSAPAANAHTGATTTNVGVTFNKAMNAATASTFIVHGGMTGKRTGTYSGGGSSTLTFDPTSDFKPNELVEVAVKGGLQSTAGDALQPGHVHQFRAAASTGPAVFSFTSANFGTGSDDTRASAAADVDADGDIDIATGNNAQQNVAYLNDGSGSFTAGTKNFGTGSDATIGIAFADVDGDGDMDVAAGNNAQQNAAYLNDGSGNFTAGTKNFGTGSDATRSVFFGDIDGDGDLDVAVGNNNQNAAYLNDGSGNFTAGTKNFGTGSDNTGDVPLADVDNDGDLDVVVGNSGQQNAAYLNDGSGNFTAGTKNFGTGSDATVPIALADVDGDGDLDVAVGNASSQQNAAYLNDGSGNFTAGTKNFGTGSDGTSALAFGDGDGDGDLDVAVGNDGGGPGEQDVVYLNDGAGNFNAGSLNFSTGSNLTGRHGLIWIDMDGDGDLDLSVANTTSQQNVAYFNSADKDGTLTASGTLDESSAIALPSTATTSGAAVDLLDFTLTDGGGGDGLALSASQVVINTSGTGPFSQVTWLLNGPDASNVSGTYNSGTNKITFSGLSVSVTDGANETYTVRGYYSTNTNLTDNATFSFSLDGDIDLTTSTLGSSMSGSNAAVSNAAGAVVGITATQLAFTTQPVPLNLTSGTQLDFTTDPVVSAQDANGNTDTDFSNTVTLAENGTGTSSFTNNTATPASGVATFSGLLFTYNAPDATSFALTASASGVTDATSSSFTFSAFPLLANNKGTLTAEDGTATLSTSVLQFTDAASTAAQIVYTIGTAPTSGQIQKSGATLGAGGTFTQDDIDNGRISYLHSGASFSDAFTFTVRGSAGLSTSSFTFGLTITGNTDSDPPTLNVLQTVQVDEGGSVVVSNGYLRVLDGDTPSSKLTFTIHSGPSHGRLTRTTFTQADVDNSLVSFVHDGSETQRDSLSFSVTDDIGLVLASTWLRFAVRSLNDGPLIPLIENQHIKEGELLLLDVAATDAEGDSVQMTVTALPPGATLEGTLFRWFPFYDQAGTYPFAVTYEDGQGGNSRLRLDIEVADAPLPVLTPEPSLLEFGDVPAGEAADLSFAFTNENGVTMELVPFSSTSPNLNVSSPELPIALQSGEKVDIIGRFSATNDIYIREVKDEVMFQCCFGLDFR